MNTAELQKAHDQRNNNTNLGFHKTLDRNAEFCVNVQNLPRISYIEHRTNLPKTRNYASQQKLVVNTSTIT